MSNMCMSPTNHPLSPKGGMAMSSGFFQSQGKSAMKSPGLNSIPKMKATMTPGTPANNHMNTSNLSNGSLCNTSWMCNLSPGLTPLYRGDFGQSPVPCQTFAVPASVAAGPAAGVCKDHPNATCNCLTTWGNDPTQAKKPPFSFPCLIGLALRSIPSGRMSVSQIYDHVTGIFPYFRTAKAGWKNSVRHNLSLNKMFCKLERRPDEQGKGAMWGITEIMRDQLDRDILQTQQRYPQKIAEAMKEPDLSAAAIALSQQQQQQQRGRATSAPTMALMSPAMQHGMMQHGGESMVCVPASGFMQAYQPFHFPGDQQQQMQPQQVQQQQQQQQQVQQVQQLQQAHLVQQHGHGHGITMMTSPGSTISRLSLPDGMHQMIDTQQVTIGDLMSTVHTEGADFFSGEAHTSSSSSSSTTTTDIKYNSQMMSDFPPSLYELTAGNGTYDLSRTELSNLELPRGSPTKFGLYSPTKLGRYSPTKMYSPTKVLGGVGTPTAYGMEDIEQLKMDFNITDLHGGDHMAPISF